MRIEGAAAGSPHSGGGPGFDPAPQHRRSADTKEAPRCHQVGGQTTARSHPIVRLPLGWQR